jgi:hypothetical protein
MTNVVPFTSMHVLLDENDVDEYLAKQGLQYGSVPIEVALLQYQGTVRGAPAIMLVLDIEGRKVLAKTTLKLMEMAVRAMVARVEGLDAEGGN